MATQEVALRKRQQIAKANRMMFIWVAIVSVVVGFAAVAAVFLWQKRDFNARVLSEKSLTADTLTKNVEAIGELKDQVRVLNTNQALKDSMAPGEDQPIRVVLDALPADANSSALGASLQEKFLKASGLTIESLTVDPVAGVESESATNVEDAASLDQIEGVGEVRFHFVVNASSSNSKVLQELLQRLERSIRTVDITKLSLEQQGGKLVLNVEGRAFYQPAVTGELKEKAVKP